MKKVLPFLIGAVLTTAGLISIPLPPQESWERAIEYCKQNPEIDGKKIDVVFVGSSRFRNGIDPKIFHRTLRDHGIDSGSVFVVSAGMGLAHQNSYTLDRLFESDSFRPEFIVVEALDFSSWAPQAATDQFGFRQRFKQWHDLENTREVFGTIAGEVRDKKMGDRIQIWIERGADHLTLFALRNYPLGRGSDIIGAINNILHGRQIDFSKGDFDFREGEEDFGISWGYEPLPEGRVHDSFNKFMEEPELFEEMLREISEYETARIPKEPDNLDAFLSQIKQVTSRGSRLVYLAVPSGPKKHRDSAPFWWMEDRGIISSTDSGTNVPVFLDGFNNPSGEYHYLHKPEFRWDAHHLNPEGVRIFSEDLGHKFIEVFYPGHQINCARGAHYKRESE